MLNMSPNAAAALLALSLFSCTGQLIAVENADNIEVIQGNPGQDIELKCNLNGFVDKEKAANVKVQWFFKQCGDHSVDLITCRINSYSENDWFTLPCDENNFCKPIVQLHNVTEKYSGLYKCTTYPYRPNVNQFLDIQLVRTYQLEVKSSMVPEILENTKANQSVLLGTRLVQHCRVFSEDYPTIKWFRRLPLGNGSHSSDLLNYNGHYYEPLVTDREKFIENKIYLSKLIINGIRRQDEGFYACVAISIRGHSIRESYVKVYNGKGANRAGYALSLQLSQDEHKLHTRNSNEEEQDYWSDYDESEEIQTDPMEFLKLFLMPVGLAILPIIVWLCYLGHKRKKQKKAKSSYAAVSSQQDEGEYASADQYMLRI